MWQAMALAPPPEKPSIGILVAGYSFGQVLPESWLVNINAGDCPPPSLVQPQGSVSCFYDGQPEAISRFCRDMVKDFAVYFKI